ncbi:hypothetical protein MLD38_008387 [Melastoma candidum]|uniref:Uncharacterized protein n=1 Tax=Melastoma candidum TaxID=119954 RepID=A0ACB9RUC6_9MYRT|nr:hypothetical protein MLD38_008387 [Melastoma candidum]
MKPKDALLCTGKILRTTHQFAQLHPNCSKTAAFFLCLFFVCPFGFRFLSYSAVTVYGSSVIIKIIANFGPFDLHESALHPSSNHESPPQLKSDSDYGIPDIQKNKKPMISEQSQFQSMEDLETLDNAEGNQVSSLGTDEGESVPGKCAKTLNEGKLISDFASEPRQNKEGRQSQLEDNDSSEEMRKMKMKKKHQGTGAKQLNGRRRMKRV